MTEPTDKFVWRGWLTGWSIAVVAVATGRNMIYLPAGVLIALIGLMLVTNLDGVRDRLREREERMNWHSGQYAASTFGGVVLTAIGLFMIHEGLGSPLA
jgi:hypothetical protein